MVQAQTRQRNIGMIVGDGFQPRPGDKHATHQLPHGPLTCFTRGLPNGGQRVAALRYRTHDDFIYGNRQPEELLTFLKEHYKITSLLSTNVCKAVPQRGKNEPDRTLHPIEAERKLFPGDLALVHNTLSLFAITLGGEPVVNVYDPIRAEMRRGNGGQPNNTALRSHSPALSQLILTAAQELSTSIKSIGKYVMGGAVRHEKSFVVPTVDYYQKAGAHLLSTSGVEEARVAKDMGIGIATVAIVVAYAPLDEHPGRIFSLSQEEVAIAVRESRRAEALLYKTVCIWSRMVGN